MISKTKSLHLSCSLLPAVRQQQQQHQQQQQIGNTSENVDKNADKNKQEEFRKYKTILYYNTQFGLESFSFGFGHRHFAESCQVSNCYTTANKSLLGISALYFCFFF